MNEADTRRARAPGKLVWLGEYAVLDGAPAVVAAVNRYAFAERGASRSGWQVTASNLSLTRGWPDVVAPDDPLALALSLLDVLAEAGLIDRDTGYDVVLDSSELFVDGGKTGLGSSAAILTALCRLLAPQLDAARAFRFIDQAHRRAQSGLGSGVDVAAALKGGVHVFQRAAPAVTPAMTNLAPPPDLHWCAVYTGTSTSTARYLARIRQWQARASWEATAYRDAMQATAVAGAEALASGDAVEFCAAAGRYGEVLYAFGRAAGVDIMSEVHSRLAAAARKVGAVYKSSGAGGGDMGVAFATEAAALARFERAAAALETCQVMALELAPRSDTAPPAK